MSEIDPVAMMAELSKQLPEESDWISACHVMADLFDSIRHKLSEEQQAMMIGIGAMIYRQGFREMQAGIAASGVMKKLMSAAPSGAADGMPPELQAVEDWAWKAEPAKLYTIPEILLLAAGVPPDSGVLNRLVGRTGQLLRGMGFRRSRMRTNGRQVTYWHK